MLLQAKVHNDVEVLRDLGPQRNAVNRRAGGRLTSSPELQPAGHFLWMKFFLAVQHFQNGFHAPRPGLGLSSAVCNRHAIEYRFVRLSVLKKAICPTIS